MKRGKLEHYPKPGSGAVWHPQASCWLIAAFWAVAFLLVPMNSAVLVEAQSVNRSAKGSAFILSNAQFGKPHDPKQRITALFQHLGRSSHIIFPRSDVSVFCLSMPPSARVIKAKASQVTWLRRDLVTREAQLDSNEINLTAEYHAKYSRGQITPTLIRNLSSGVWIEGEHAPPSSHSLLRPSLADRNKMCANILRAQSSISNNKRLLGIRDGIPSKFVHNNYGSSSNSEDSTMRFKCGDFTLRILWGVYFGSSSAVRRYHDFIVSDLKDYNSTAAGVDLGVCRIDDNKKHSHNEKELFHAVLHSGENSFASGVSGKELDCGACWLAISYGRQELV